jgi:hypothetical protein
MRAYHDIEIEDMVPTKVMVTKFKKGERQWHFNYDG